MAGDWIKMNKSLPRDPRVVRIASACGADRLRIVGALFSAWCLFDEQTPDGILQAYTAELVDELVGVTGLARAMEAVGWLTIGDGFVAVPRFDEHNGQSAKRRAKESDRKASARKADKRPQAERTNSGTREEKNREDIEEKEHGELNSLCTLRQALDHARNYGLSSEQATKWWNHREAVGWVRSTVGEGAPIKIISWQADMAGWKNKNNPFPTESNKTKSRGGVEESIPLAVL